jgi:hypothetical protein
MNFEWVMEAYVVCCTRNQRNGLAKLKLGILEIRRIRKGSRTGDALYVDRKKMLYISLECLEMRKRRKQLLRKWAHC